ncbi:MAG: ribulose-phosphate 3-epimerase [Coriobacteriales bacterium]|jgi:ribulose-phosphate 3-epimerase|nr:ribulose-phosphate 3-epimerase [Coriobacteriales bacterium]
MNVTTSPRSTIQLAPSLLSADFMNLERDVRMIEDAAFAREGIAPPEWLHIDVMDGHFVPNLTIGPPVVQALKRIARTPLDVHLMIDNPAEQLDWFIEAGADLITVSIECAGNASPAGLAGAGSGDGASNAAAFRAGSSRSVEQLADPELIDALISRIHAAGRKAGLALNPQTPFETLLPFVSELDLILVMSVHPGFGGQTFISKSVEKVAAIAAALSERGSSALIEVDGGINAQTAPLVAVVGATVLVAGSAVFGATEPRLALQAIRDAANEAQGAAQKA